MYIHGIISTVWKAIVEGHITWQLVTSVVLRLEVKVIKLLLATLPWQQVTGRFK